VTGLRGRCRRAAWRGYCLSLHLSLWRRTRDRQTVQLGLAYLATGFALLQFVMVVFRDHPSVDSIVDAALVIYVLGFAVVVFAVPLVLTGTHKFRSGLIAGIVLASMAAGVYVRGRWMPGATVANAPAMVEADSASGEEDATDTVGPPRNVPGTLAGMGGVVGGPAAQDPPADRVVTAGETGDGPGPTNADQPPTSAVERPVAEPVAPARTALDRVVLLYGESDRVVVGRRPGVGPQLFEGFETPISLRFHSVSSGFRLNVEVGAGTGAEVLDLSVLGQPASMQVRVPTSCGALTYMLEAARLSDDQAEVTATLDRDRARQEVERAEALGTCRIVGGE